MAVTNITSLASASSIPLNVNGQININVSGYPSWNFDINMTSTAATGNIYIYTQNTNPTGDAFMDTVPTAIPVTGGNFGAGVTRQTVLNNSVVVCDWVIVKWVGSDAGSPVGNVAIVGSAQIF